MRPIFVMTLLLFTSLVKGQNSIEWDGIYQLQLSDFQSQSTQIGGVDIYSLHSGSVLDFSFYMTNAEFMFTKNFNSKVHCAFNRSAAVLVAPDSITAIDLLHFARYEFDLAELYARELRKRLFEEKGAFSDITFFRPVYDEIIQEFNERHATAGKIADVGRNRAALDELHQEVLSEIAVLADFCKTCKPPKKKK